jgi:hypothetical protein
MTANYFCLVTRKSQARNPENMKISSAISGTVSGIIERVDFDRRFIEIKTKICLIPAKSLLIFINGFLMDLRFR